jgi:hypothetical protein
MRSNREPKADMKITAAISQAMGRAMNTPRMR